jgi:hypothetical protein
MDHLDLSERGHRGLGVISTFTLEEGESVTFVLREPPKPTTSGVGRENETCPHHGTECGETKATSSEDPVLTQALLNQLLLDTTSRWVNWVSQCTYKGRWRETCIRSALAIKVGDVIFVSSPSPLI